MRYLILALALLVALGSVTIGDAAPRARCEFGRVQGFAKLQADPLFLIGTVPSRFTTNARFFQRRYNCMRTGVAVRRVDLGQYDVKFPGLNRLVPLVTAISEEGVSASVHTVAPGTYRVSLRGPLLIDGTNVLQRRDVAFSIALF